ncbi:MULTISPECIES: methyl-accepting chemotaxis protein [Aliivibrio]|uniref:Methyl-accepting chemotaxis protein n=1 Tax=Aliivibrio finisterrensis TaxID=511998 RepID=A0A4Q5KY96_9GAMM|nr:MULTISPECIES: methyl-accepting chemotaxis protein [Aliivibrio]MDD9178889.1 methyl-accepting chemotaxis protein [Aliivibrio sp. A6]RYU51736.1 methyl-accepting chemotaxis protein [Aliivibrio finisterrensis]RYU53210.1 methyl-accepting chemotaxis protein [Aliivibrio finisterrensis]RYU58668.1 methyl-accepting chemotaxis protein [Aliivibrio finisterrensis]RYU64843.1 methyl-accepting chemotaxis protein [Aliivibrio finisterrensis]
MKNYSLKKKILFITLLSLVSVVFLLSWQSYSEQKKHVYETALQQLNRLSDLHSTKIDEWMNFRISIVNGLANHKNDSEDLLYLAQSSGGFLISYYTYYDGRLLTSDPTLDVTGLDLRDADWYMDAQKQSSILVTSPYLEPILKDTVVTIAKATDDAVVASDLSIATLIKQVSEMALPDNGEALLIDKDGKIIAYKDKELVQQSISKVSAQLNIQQVEQASKNKQLTQVIFDSQNKEKLVWAMTIPDLNWTLLLAIDKETLDAPLKAQLTSQLLSAGIVLLLSILIMVYVMNLMFAPLLRITHALGAIANGNGDLTQRLKIESHDEIGELANSFNVFTDSQHALIRHINQQSVDLEKDASQGVENSQLTMKSLESQQENLISVATAMNQMSGAASDIAMNAAQTATAAQQSTKNSEDGLTLASSTRHSVQQLALEVSNTTDVISELNSHVNSISGILVTIQAIAEQTNLLALNAAIEAARAGEQGRGFAVVADEVRVLSKRTQDSTQEIYSMIETLQKSTSKVVEAMESNKQTVEGTVSDIDHLADSLNESNQAIALISDMATQIATAAEEQSQVILEMNDNTMTIKETSEDIMLSAQSSLGQAQELKMHADSLNEQVSQFKI